MNEEKLEKLANTDTKIEIPKVEPDKVELTSLIEPEKPVEKKSSVGKKLIAKDIKTDSLPNAPTADVPDEKITEEIMVVEGINKAFPSPTGPIPVLTDISFKVLRGSFNIVFGPSGSGKTTVLNTILGLETPDTGTVKFYDNDIYKMSQDELTQFRSQHFGVVYQSSNWVQSLNALENVALPLLFLGIDEKLSYEKAMENLEIVGMADFAKRDPKTMSGGQQQRISLARSLINNPWVIVADEPTGNLDTKAGTDVMQLLYDLSKNQKRTIILVTHNLDYVILASQMIYIRDGRLASREEALPKPIEVKL